ncbi:MAG: hypothetical protein RLN81_07955 [Balneolaceae bacterium]
MSEILFKSEEDITDDWIFYIENEAKSLAEREKFNIENYIDRNLFNPDIQHLISSKNFDKTLEKSDLETDFMFQETNFAFKLSEQSIQKDLSESLKLNFQKLRSKVKKIFCNVVRGMENLDGKEIIKAVLIALIPAFASGIPALVLPILIGLIAYLFKYGIDKTCPI